MIRAAMALSIVLLASGHGLVHGSASGPTGSAVQAQAAPAVTITLVRWPFT